MRRINLRAWVSGALIAAASLNTNAAGLGRLDVKSVLGEPLRAEVAVLAKAGEWSSLKVQLASPQAYDAASLIYTPLVSQLAVTLHLDEGEKPVVRITSAGPINDAVLDLLLELTWASGRVTREYTAFIDPPFIAAERDQQRVDEEIAATRALEEAARGAETQAATVPPAPTPEPLPEEPLDIEELLEDPMAEESPAEIATQEADLGPVETFGGTAPTLLGTVPTIPSSEDTNSVIADESLYITDEPIKVVRGDTLSKIALANKPAGVTLNQMLVVLLRNNPQAFSGNNMNRLRAGKIIQLADPEEYRQVTVAEANNEVRVQTTNWKAYKQQLAAATAQRPEELPQQAAGGTVTPKIQEQAPSSTDGSSPEVVKLSKGEPAAGQGTNQGASAALQEKLVSTENALEESNQRVARLEKIIKDLERLAEVENQDMAEMQSQAGAAVQPAPTPAVPPAATMTPDKPSQPPAPAKPDQASENIQPAPDSAAPAKPGQTNQQAATTGTAATPAATPKPPAATATTQPKPKPAARHPRSRPPPSLLDKALAQPYLIAIPVIVIALIGLVVWRLRGRFSSLRGGFGKASGGAATAVDSETASGTFSPDATDIGLAGRSGETGEQVDPLEEAEIFLAYGRDAQAEELLQEAIATHPTRYDIHLKLLEIYAKQSNTEAFEKVARTIQQDAGSEGEVWQHVARLGYSMDPENPRYAEGAGEQGGQTDHDQTAATATDMSPAEHLDFDVGVGDSTDLGASSNSETDIDLGENDDFAKTQVMSPATSDPGDDSTAIESDLNLDLPPLESGASALDLSVGDGDGDNSVDFDFDSNKVRDQPENSEAAEETATTNFDPGLEFNLDDMSFGSDSEEQAESLETESLEAPSLETGSLDTTALDSASLESVSSDAPPALDLSGISLDLDATTTGNGPSDASGKDDKWYEVQTKFDLAKAYQEMGDNDGAREILKEVISEGDSDQKSAAETVLSSLG